ncbi:MAG: hypothetical protein RLN90_09545 [Balneolaceae bacterium]
MKATNEAIHLELQNAVTKEINTFKLVDHAVPAQVYLQMAIEEVFEKKQAYIKKHKLPLKPNGDVDVPAIKKTAHIEQLNAFNEEVYTKNLDRLSSVIELVGELPKRYKNQREVLTHCMNSDVIIPQVMAVFIKRSGSTISLPERGTNLIQWKRPNGEKFDPLNNQEKEQGQD